MKIVNASAKYLNASTLHPYAFMEMAGRTCYKSNDNITDTSAVKFVQGLQKSGHTAMLEHAHIILNVGRTTLIRFLDELRINDVFAGTCLSGFENDFTPIRSGNYLSFTIDAHVSVISGSFRAFLNLYDLDKYSYSLAIKSVLGALHDYYPEIFDKDYGLNEIDRKCINLMSRQDFVDYVHKRCSDKDRADAIIRKHLTHTILFTCDRGVSHEFVRHRVCSFAQESTRYCNYSKDKFGNEITVIEPCFWEKGSTQYALWEQSCKESEKAYFQLMAVEGVKAQEARSVLPNSLKTELIITATEEEWQHIINLRYHGTTGAPHPQMVEVMAKAYPMLQGFSDGRLK